VTAEGRFREWASVGATGYDLTVMAVRLRTDALAAGWSPNTLALGEEAQARFLAVLPPQTLADAAMDPKTGLLFHGMRVVTLSGAGNAWKVAVMQADVTVADAPHTFTQQQTPVQKALQRPRPRREVPSAPLGVTRVITLED
jgi:hypothetical protein